MRGLVATAAISAVAVALFAPAPVAAGTPVPRNGTYAGAGTLTGDAQYGVELGFTVRRPDVMPIARLFEFPGCTGGFFLPDMTLVENHFEGTTSTPSPPETNSIQADFVTRTRIKGTVTLQRPDAASCGDPGTYVYEFKARRYGKP